MNSTRLLATLLAVVLVIASCGRADDDAGSNGDGGQSSQGDSDSDGVGESEGNGSSSSGGGFTTDDARADATGAGEDFPISIPGGWEVDQFEALADAGAAATGVVGLLYANEDFDKLVAFYDEWTASQPDEYGRNESPDGVIYTRSSPLAQISVLKDFEDRGEIWTALSVSAASE